MTEHQKWGVARKICKFPQMINRCYAKFGVATLCLLNMIALGFSIFSLVCFYHKSQFEIESSRLTFSIYKQY